MVFERNGRCIAKQAPLVGDCCVRAPCTSRWCAPEVECPRCRGRYCSTHFRDHLRAVVVPRDSWRSLRKRFASARAKVRHEHGADALEALPFVLGSYCKTPSGPRATLPCGFTSDKCRGEERGCPRCRFTFCQAHFSGHVVRFVMPRRLLLTVLDTYRRQLDEVAEGRRQHIRVRLPPVTDW